MYTCLYRTRNFQKRNTSPLSTDSPSTSPSFLRTGPSAMLQGVGLRPPAGFASPNRLNPVMASIFAGQPLQNKAEIPIKTRVIWALGICVRCVFIYIYIHMCQGRSTQLLLKRGYIYPTFFWKESGINVFVLTPTIGLMSLSPVFWK